VVEALGPGVTWILRLFGITVAELICKEPEVVIRIDNTSGSYELDTEALEAQYEDDDEEGYIPPEDPIYRTGFGFRRT